MPSSWLSVRDVGLGVVAAIVFGIAQATQNVYPCAADAADRGYMSRVHEIVRSAQDAAMEPLIFMRTRGIQPGEIILGLSESGEHRNLIRLEFDPSLHIASTVEIAPDRYTNDYTDATVRVTQAKVPISDALAAAFKDTLNELESEPRVRRVLVTEYGNVLEEISTDTVTHQLMLAGARCVEVTTGHDTLGLEIIRMNYFFARALQSWTREGAAQFEVQALLLLNEISGLNRAKQ